MDPNVLHDCAVEELNGVPDGQGYTVDQFLAYSSIETRNGAKALFSASEPGSPTGSPSGRCKTVRRSVAMVERACLTQHQQQAILDELSFMWLLRHHPHVVDYTNCFPTLNFLAITGEFANMGTLGNFLKRFSRASTRTQFQQQDPTAAAGVPAAPARFLFQQLVMVVDYCHRINQSIGGGLTPDNVVIFWNGSAPQVKIAATGRSGALSPAASPDLPTFAFKAPECVLGNGDVLPGDIFSLGSLLFYALAGRLPFSVAQGETEQAWASRVSRLELDIPQHVPNTEGLHSLLRGMLAPPERRWTLSEIKQHPFFTTNLPEGALNLSDKVAAADVGGEPEYHRVYSNLQDLLSRCGDAPQPHSAPPVPEVQYHAAHEQPEPVSAVPHPQFTAERMPSFTAEGMTFGVNVGQIPSGLPVATASGYTTVASKELSMQLNADFAGACSLQDAPAGDGTMPELEGEVHGGNMRCGAIGEGLEADFMPPQPLPQQQQQRSQELAHVYSDMHGGKGVMHGGMSVEV